MLIFVSKFSVGSATCDSGVGPLHFLVILDIMKRSQKTGRSLEKAMNTKVPLTALPTDDLIEDLGEYDTQIGKEQPLRIDRVAYVKHENDIFCSFYLQTKQKAIFAPIAHLDFQGEGELFKQIKVYQQQER